MLLAIREGVILQSRIAFRQMSIISLIGGKQMLRGLLI